MWLCSGQIKLCSVTFRNVITECIQIVHCWVPITHVQGRFLLIFWLSEVKEIVKLPCFCLRQTWRKKNHTILPMFYKRYNKILYLLLINAITCHFVWHQRSPSCWPKGNMKRNNRNNALVLVAKSLLAGKLKTSLSCAFLTRGTLWVLQGFNPLQCVTNAVLDDRGPPNCLQIIKRLFISL